MDLRHVARLDDSSEREKPSESAVVHSDERSNQDVAFEARRARAGQTGAEPDIASARPLKAGAPAPPSMGNSEVVSDWNDETGLPAGAKPVSRLKPQSERGAWDHQRKETEESFGALLQKNFLAADDFKLAASPRTPSDWQRSMPSVSSSVARAALAGVGGAVVAAVGKGAALAVGLAMDAAKRTARTRAQAIAANAREDQRQALAVFCQSQKHAMLDAKVSASKEFRKQAGTFTSQQLTIEEMASIEKANRKAYSRANEIQRHEMTIGWMNLSAGDGALQAALLNGGLYTKQRGVLFLVIAGSDDRPTVIREAKLQGINAALAKQLAATPVSQWLNVSGNADDVGLDLQVVTGSPDDASDSFEASAATIRRMASSGMRANHLGLLHASREMGHPKAKVLSFAIGKERNGGSTRIDTQRHYGPQDYYRPRGLWFLQNVRSADDIIADVSKLVLPMVG